MMALARHEGIVPAPYRDSGGTWTFGIGHTAAAGPPDPAGMPRGMPEDLDAALAQALELFRGDLRRVEREVLEAVRVPLAQHEFDALVSFHFNTGGIGRAALTRHLNSGDREAAARAFMGWRRPEAIIPRREAEQELFRTGRYVIGSVPVWRADERGQVDFSAPVRLLQPAAILAWLDAGAADASGDAGWPGRLISALWRLLGRRR
ncbi:lysozyme [Meinhardsimonia xiamenensis]|jgi:lysozyme|nr:lysozyme [Meinhardsimonia xiamenensis]